MLILLARSAISAYNTLMRCTVWRSKQGVLQMSKVFRFAGVSRQEGVMKARFSNRDSYSAVLAKEGHTDIAILELPKSMTQEEAVAHLKAAEFSQDPEVMGALEARIARKESAPKSPAKSHTPAAAETSQGVKNLAAGWMAAMQEKVPEV